MDNGWDERGTPTAELRFEAFVIQRYQHHREILVQNQHHSSIR